ncbi:DUF6397 family protein [Streptomyces sp. NPDC057257]|uniref:DUF6397 family protein n=1 Tax=Streptomyces sp. NPDC057257 TaxID=3346071 RepID=UPI00363CEFEA
MSGNTVTTPSSTSCTPSRAARELELKRGQFDLAVNLGYIRTVPDEGGGGPRVPRTEIERLRGEDGFPETLTKRLATVGTREGADLLKVSMGRFTRLARLGIVVPVHFYLNRYRAVVWLYLAEELREFAADESKADLLTGRIPAGFRELVQEGVDLRARNWRQRQLTFLRRRAGDHPWAQAAAVASVLDPLQVAEVVQDPYERLHLSRFLPKAVTYGAPGSPGAQLTERLTHADDPAEVGWLSAELVRAVGDARRRDPAPRPAGAPPVADGREPATEDPGRSRGLLGWLRRRNP